MATTPGLNNAFDWKVSSPPRARKKECGRPQQSVGHARAAHLRAVSCAPRQSARLSGSEAELFHPDAKPAGRHAEALGEGQRVVADDGRERFDLRAFEIGGAP